MNKKTSLNDFHLEYISNVKNVAKNKSLFDKLSPVEAFELACNLIEVDAEDYTRYMKHKLKQTWGLGMAIGVGISLIGIFISLIILGLIN